MMVATTGLVIIMVAMMIVDSMMVKTIGYW